MCIAQILNSVGLSFDIAGAIILFIFPLPVIRKGKEGIYMFDTSDHESIAKHINLSRVGIGLLAIGFTFQLLSNMI